MIHTRICDLLAIEYPIVLGGMGRATSAPVVAAVSNAGGLGSLGSSGMNAAELGRQIEAIRKATEKPFAINHLLFKIDEESFSLTLKERPPVIAFAWPRSDQEIESYFERSRAVGSKVIFMAGEAPLAKRAKEAGADVIVAQGTEGGGHVGWMASMALVPMVVDAVSPCPVLAAGGFADGRGLAAALALGADGVLLGTRMLATEESPLHPNYKHAIVNSDGHDTVLTEIPDIATGQVWPGAMSRVMRNDFVARWAGREWALRRCYQDVGKDIMAAWVEGNVDNGALFYGQDAGLIHSILPAAEVVWRMAAEAEEIIKGLQYRLSR